MRGFLLGSILLLALKSCECTYKSWDEDKSQLKWNKYAMDKINEVLAKKLNRNIAKNVILFLGDGMGLSTVTTGRIRKGQMQGRNGEEEVTHMESFPHVGLSKTYSIDAQTTDSAGTATAFLCGVKTIYGSIGLDGSAVDCNTTTAESKLESVLKWAYYAGKSTGIVTTTRVTHATPAAAYAHSYYREFEAYDNVYFKKSSFDLGCRDIASQLIDDNNFINLVMGGGRRKFLTTNEKDYQENKFGQRVDNRSLINEWISKMQQQNKTHKFLWNRTEFDALKPNQYDHILALLNYDHMQYEVERNISQTEPSIIEMTKKAIELLSTNPNGYFLLVEGGRIDHAHHQTNARRALDEFVVFDEAIGLAKQLVSLDDTLFIVTADHSHVYTLGGYAFRGDDLFDILRSKETNLTNEGLTYTPLLYGNGPGFVKNRTYNLTSAQTMNINYRQETVVPLTDESHGGEDVSIYAAGPMSFLFDGTFEQNYIAHVMAYSACIGPYNETFYPECKLRRGLDSGASSINFSCSNSIFSLIMSLTFSLILIFKLSIF